MQSYIKGAATQLHGQIQTHLDNLSLHLLRGNSNLEGNLDFENLVKLGSIKFYTISLESLPYFYFFQCQSFHFLYNKQ